MPDLTRTQRSNLKKLSAYLRALPRACEHFDMGKYYLVEDGAVAPGPHEVPMDMPCGAVACAIGHGPAAGIKVPRVCGTWNEFSRRALGVEACGDAWIYMFGPRNSDDPVEAADRIDNFLKGSVDYAS